MSSAKVTPTKTQSHSSNAPPKMKNNRIYQKSWYYGVKVFSHDLKSRFVCSNQVCTLSSLVVGWLVG
jgi:hypothetical protein